MTPMALLLNLLWLVFGGVWMALGWGVAAVVMAITIIGIPWARAAFNIAVYTLLPFGYTAVSRDEHLGRGDIGTGPLGVIGNIITPIPAAGVGEIAYVQSGTRYTAPAREDTGAPVASGAAVKIVRIVGSQFYVKTV